MCFLKIVLVFVLLTYYYRFNFLDLLFYYYYFQFIIIVLQLKIRNVAWQPTEISLGFSSNIFSFISALFQLTKIVNNFS